MSEPTYKITLGHIPTNTTYKWQAYIRLVSDDSLLVVELAETEDDVIKAAQMWVARNRTKQPRRVYYMTESGELADAPAMHSVKA